MAKAKRPQIRLRRPAVDVKKLADGSYVLRSPYPPVAGAGSMTIAALEGLWIWPDGIKLQALCRAEEAQAVAVEALLSGRDAKIIRAEFGTGKKSIDNAELAITKAKPHIYVDSAAGLAALLPRLEKKEDVRKAFFSRLGAVITVDGLIGPKHRKRLAKMADDLPVIGLWAPEPNGEFVTIQCGDPDSDDNIGLPLPGAYLKLVPTKVGYSVMVTPPGRMDSTEPTSDEYRDIRVNVDFRDHMRPFKGFQLVQNT